jgi:hypothetical protein
MVSRILKRACLATILLISTGALSISYVGAEGNPQDWQQTVPERENATVITTQSYAQYPNNGAIVAFGADGKTMYHNNTYDVYFDVDPLPDTQRSVLYVAADRTRCENVVCWKNTINRVNLTTGAHSVLYTHINRKT